MRFLLHQIIAFHKADAERGSSSPTECQGREGETQDEELNILTRSHQEQGKLLIKSNLQFHMIVTLTPCGAAGIPIDEKTDKMGARETLSAGWTRVLAKILAFLAIQNFVVGLFAQSSERVDLPKR